MNCRIIVVFLAIAFSAQIANAQDTRRDVVIQQLLDCPAPPPPVSEEIQRMLDRAWWHFIDLPENPVRSIDENSSNMEVVNYWYNQRRDKTGKKPTIKEGLQLLDAHFAFNDVRSLDELLPNSPVIASRALQLFENPHILGLGSYQYLEERKEGLKSWLMRHSEYFRPDLIREAAKVSVKENSLQGERAIEALCRLDWKAAQPVLEAISAGSDPNLKVFVLKLTYLHAIEEKDFSTALKLRHGLLDLTTAVDTPELSRQLAYDALITGEWEGQKEWFTTMLSLKAPGVDLVTGQLLNRCETWVPHLIRLTGNSDSTLSNRAKSTLVSVARQKPNRETLLPLLPLILDPSWIRVRDDYSRVKVISAMEKAELPEAVPAIISLIRSGKLKYLSFVVEGLESYRDPIIRSQLILAVREILDGYQVPEETHSLSKLLVKLGGVNQHTALNAIQSYISVAEITEHPIGVGPSFRISEPGDYLQHIGAAIVEAPQPATSVITPPFIRAAVETWQSIRKSNPELAWRLWTLIRSWNSPEADSAALEQVIDGTADVNTMVYVLKNCKRMSPEAIAMAGAESPKNEYLRGLLAVIQGSTTEVEAILARKDKKAQIGLLAGARIARDVLPLGAVIRLLSMQDKQISLAAERYLESNDSADARQILWKHHPGEALVLGSFEGFSPKEPYYLSSGIIEWEDRLRSELKSGKIDKAFGYYSFTQYDAGSKLEVNTIRVVKDHAELCQIKSKLDQVCRELVPEELSEIRETFDGKSFDELVPLIIPGGGYHNNASSFLRLTREGGRRVFTPNIEALEGERLSASAPAAQYLKLINLFKKLAANENEIR